MMNFDTDMVATGDDNGYVKVWDLRQQKCAMKFHDSDDFISSMTFNANKNKLCCTSGDGCLSVLDLRKGRPYAKSDNTEEELLSIALLKHGKKVIVGSQEGVVMVYTWDDFGDMSDRIPGLPNSLDCMLAYDDDVVIVGSSDGLIRAISIHPNSVMGVIGEHPDFPVERMSLSGDGLFVASCSHDMTVKFWNIDYLDGYRDEHLANDNDEDDEDDDDDFGDDGDDYPDEAAQANEETQEDDQQQQQEDDTTLDIMTGDDEQVSGKPFGNMKSETTSGFGATSSSSSERRHRFIKEVPKNSKGKTGKYKKHKERSTFFDGLE
eukprot:TRINITY_DN2118_c2_g1_i2.p1 TRINITY_DN2118_c2_g1~~TRINITY_DN2118_c2_g1_i2.p1  ORF type:complete len:321 (+),score=134.19 TRINITY_DN2118_c2_g1_i2:419-1381(+)